jgi:phosphoribosylanthranilate isomerase
MRHVVVKVCGLRSPEHVIAAAEAGADYVGFVMTKSRRRVTPEDARQLSRTAHALRRGLRTVGVFTDEPASELNRSSQYCGFDVVQVTARKGVGYLCGLKQEIIRVLHVAPGTSARSLVDGMERANAVMHQSPPIHLLDTHSPDVGGGTGKTFDWAIAKEVSQRHPVFVAGGLTPANVRDLILDVRPLGVDVSSGIEVNGAKDVELIRAFIDAVRKAEQEIADAEDAIAR